METPWRRLVVDATSHDLREYRERFADRQKAASVNAALAALQRFYGWTLETGRVKTNPTSKLRPSPFNRWRQGASLLLIVNGSVAKPNELDLWRMRSPPRS